MRYSYYQPILTACGRILHGSKSFGKYLQCFHVSRVYFFAFLHQIFILEVFIIKKNATVIADFLNFEHFLLLTLVIIWLHIFFATDTSEMHLSRFKIATDNVGRKGHTFQPGLKRGTLDVNSKSIRTRNKLPHCRSISDQPFWKSKFFFILK